MTEALVILGFTAALCLIFAALGALAELLEHFSDND